MFSAAVAEGLLPVTPCKVPNATKVRRARSVVHIESPEVDVLAGKMPEDLAAAVLLAAWCGLRFGEVVALDRADVATDGSTVNVSKGMTRRGGVTEIAAPKSETSIRVVAVPPHVREALTSHLVDHTGPGDGAPLFTDADGQRITEGKFRPHWHRARAAAGRETLRFHDLRHHAGMVAAYAGATIAESMLHLTDNVYLIWAMVIVFLLFVGMFMETLAAILILTPVLLPVMYTMGADPTHVLRIPHDNPPGFPAAAWLVGGDSLPIR